MAQDNGRRGGRGRQDERGPEWRGDEGFGGGWGNQVPRPHRLGDRNWRGQSDDPYGDSQRYGPGEGHGYGGGGGWYGPATTSTDYRYGGPGLDTEFSNGPRFDQVDVGRAGGHGAYPVASSSNLGYGPGAGGGFGSSAREYMLAHDPHYTEWRHRQMAEFDRDYEDYRREHQSRFDREFGEWRGRRQEQRAAVGRVTGHMEVVGADGEHVGTVDCTRGDRLVLTRNDDSAGGIHHMIPCGWIDRVEDKVILNLDAKEARRRWEEDHRSRALFERERGGERGPHVLNRSFAGTYRGER
ncbi:MAG: DUF2171 domain-containing protein [Alphaproteobacteria bacterium]|nr:MAG: DUF2171 domain-containing protein [Alphaproteobacteria bacterium]